MNHGERDLSQDVLEQRVRQCCEHGDYAAAVTLLLETVGPKVLAFLVQRLGNTSDASEVFSMFSEDVWRGLPGFEWRCTVRGWSFAIARAAACRYRMQAEQQHKRRLPLSEAPLSALVESVRERTLAFLRTEVKTQMQQLFTQLPEDDRALLQLRIDQQLSWRDLALVLDYAGEVPSDEALTRSAAKLRKRFQSVKERLRRMAEEAGLLAEAT